MKNTELKCAVQAILFASGAPVPLETISRALEQKPKQTQLILDELIREYSSEEYGIKIVRLEDSYRSMGIGLNLCAQIIHAHGGSIEVLDNEPTGALFRFRLPAADLDSAEMQPADLDSI